jgi:hypothetical protein
MNYQTELKNLKPSHEFFIGIDSDGCVFDTMEVKQKEFFIPNALKHFNLLPISKIVRETWEFVNLYSVHRGGNRYISIIKVFELLLERDEIRNSAIKLPDLTSLRKWVTLETKLGTESLKKFLELNYDPDLANIVRWTDAVNIDISLWLHNIPPFPNAKKAIINISSEADLIVSSQTPLEAITREWEENEINTYVRVIAGQEHGTKTGHIELAAKGKYPDNKIMIIGDAIGDMVAAERNNILFYPVIPGTEDKCWERFIDEAYGKFKNGTFEGNYQDSLHNEFKKSLPETPPWK